MITLLAMTDGRPEYLHETIASFDAMAHPGNLVTRRIIHNDCPDPAFADWLAHTYSGFEIVPSWQSLQGKRSGFTGAIRSAWSHLRAFPGTERFILHLEEDFTFNRPVPLDDMAEVLDAQPQLAQLALRRQPWSDTERQAGGVVELNPGEYLERQTQLADGRPVAWLEHRLFWTTNVSLYRMSLMADQDWPDVEHSEGMFTIQLREDPALRFAYWGARNSGEAITHIGHRRSGTGY